MHIFKGQHKSTMSSLSSSWLNVARQLMLGMLFLLPTASSAPRRTEPDITSKLKHSMSRLRSSGKVTSQSHLVMWMRTEKELLPLVLDLADSARSLLMDSVTLDGSLTLEELERLVSSLPNIFSVADVPSERVLKDEQKDTFVKSLVENAYQSLEEVIFLVKKYVISPSDDVTSADDHDFLSGLEDAKKLYAEVMLSFYRSDPQTLTPTPKIDRDQSLSTQDLKIKILDLAYNRLTQISSVLEYSLEFSWLERFGKKSKKGGQGKGNKSGNKNKKKNKE